MLKEIITMKSFLKTVKQNKDAIRKAIEERKEIIASFKNKKLSIYSKHISIPLPSNLHSLPKKTITYADDNVFFCYNHITDIAYVIKNPIKSKILNAIACGEYIYKLLSATSILLNDKIFLIHKYGYIDIKNKINYEIDREITCFFPSYFVSPSITILLITNEFTQFSLLNSFISPEFKEDIIF